MSHLFVVTMPHCILTPFRPPKWMMGDCWKTRSRQKPAPNIIVLICSDATNKKIWPPLGLFNLEILLDLFVLDFATK